MPSTLTSSTRRWWGTQMAPTTLSPTLAELTRMTASSPQPAPPPHHPPPMHLPPPRLRRADEMIGPSCGSRSSSGATVGSRPREMAAAVMVSALTICSPRPGCLPPGDMLRLRGTRNEAEGWPGGERCALHGDSPLWRVLACLTRQMIWTNKHTHRRPGQSRAARRTTAVAKCSSGTGLPMYRHHQRNAARPILWTTSKDRLDGFGVGLEVAAKARQQLTVAGDRGGLLPCAETQARLQATAQQNRHEGDRWR